jgi:hypothetical protein
VIHCNPSTWEAEAGDAEFGANLGYTVRPSLKTKNREKYAIVTCFMEAELSWVKSCTCIKNVGKEFWAWCCLPVIPVLRRLRHKDEEKEGETLCQKTKKAKKW